MMIPEKSRSPLGVLSIFKDFKMESKRGLGTNLLEYKRKITGHARYKSLHPSGGETEKRKKKPCCLS